jgi:hypothetical protein
MFNSAIQKNASMTDNGFAAAAAERFSVYTMIIDRSTKAGIRKMDPADLQLESW